MRYNLREFLYMYLLYMVNDIILIRDSMLIVYIDAESI